jgi:hypothetical protein
MLMKSEHWIVRLGRLGYAVKGIVYITVGFLAIQGALGLGGGTTDVRGALRTIRHAPFGTIGLLIVSAGLLGYAVWRIVSAITDAERRGDAPTSIALRLGEAFRGFVYGALGAWALKYLVDGRSERTDQAKELTNRALDLPAGRWVVIGTGLGIVGYALYQLYRAVKRKFLKRLDFSDADERTKAWIEHLGVFGVAARAVVFGIFGGLITRAGWHFRPSEAGGIEKSLDLIANYALILAIVAAGLIAFGALQIATARYRRMRFPSAASVSATVK